MNEAKARFLADERARFAARYEPTVRHVSKSAKRRRRKKAKHRAREAKQIRESQRFASIDLRESFPFSWPVGDARPVYIYAIVHPRKGTVRYVGKSVDRVRRDSEHLANRWQGNRELADWIRLRRGNIEIHHLDVVGEPHWAEAERAWIAFFRSHGRLYNIEDGGPSRKHPR